MNEKVDIQVFRRRLTVEMEGLTPLEIKALATKVDDKMNEISHQNKGVADSSLLAILTSLHFAADLEKTHAARETEQIALEKKVEELTLALRSALSHVAK